MEHEDGINEFNALRALVSELRERLAPLSPAEWDHVGNYMLKALWLGQKQPHDLVFKNLDTTEPPNSTHPHLRVVK